MSDNTGKYPAYLIAGGLWLNSTAVFADGASVPITATITPAEGRASTLIVSDGVTSETFTVTPLEWKNRADGQGSDFRIYREISDRSTLLRIGTWLSGQIPPPGVYAFVANSGGDRRPESSRYTSGRGTKMPFSMV